MGKQAFDKFGCTKTGQYHSWFVMAGKHKLLSFYDLDDHTYFFGIPYLVADKLTIRLLEDKISDKKLQSSGELKAFVAKLDLDLEGMWDEGSELSNLVRVK